MSRPALRESPVWLAAASKRKAKTAALLEGQEWPATLFQFLPTFLFLVVLMTAFMSFSHGTQDVYPTFLAVQMKLSPETIGLIGVLYGFGSIARGIAFPDRCRRNGDASARLSLRRFWRSPVIPLTPTDTQPPDARRVGAVLMQFMVQGAWGVVPGVI